MKSTIVSATLAVHLFAGSCLADFVLRIDEAGNAAIKNTGDSPIDFDGYAIQCELASGEGCADPTTWVSIEDQVLDDAVEVLGRLGAGGLGFSEANPTSKQLSEITLGAGGVLQPNEEIPLGKPFVQTLSFPLAIARNELRWEWTSPTLGTTEDAPIAAIPEPAASLFFAAILSVVGIHRYHRKCASTGTMGNAEEEMEFVTFRSDRST